MKTTIVAMSLLMTTVAFAAPAAAQCAPDLGSGTYACAYLDDPSNQYASASQSGVGGAGYSHYEFEFWGTTYEGTYAFAYTEDGTPVGFNYLAFSDFCMSYGDGCVYQDSNVFYYGAAGYAFVMLSQSDGGRYLCVMTGDVFHCQAV